MYTEFIALLVKNKCRFFFFLYICKYWEIIETLTFLFSGTGLDWDEFLSQTQSASNQFS